MTQEIDLRDDSPDISTEEAYKLWLGGMITTEEAVEVHENTRRELADELSDILDQHNL